jgi:hypothetical protein
MSFLNESMQNQALAQAWQKIQATDVDLVDAFQEQLRQSIAIEKGNEDFFRQLPGNNLTEGESLDAVLDRASATLPDPENVQDVELGVNEAFKTCVQNWAQNLNRGPIDPTDHENVRDLLEQQARALEAAPGC